MNLKLPSQSEIPTCIVYAPRIAEAKRWDFPKQPRLEEFCPRFFFPEDFFPVSVFHEMKQERPVKFTRFIGPVGDLNKKNQQKTTPPHRRLKIRQDFKGWTEETAKAYCSKYGNVMELGSWSTFLDVFFLGGTLW